MTYFKMKMTFDTHKTPSEHIMIHHILEYIPIYGKCATKFPAIFLCCTINVRFLCITFVKMGQKSRKCFIVKHRLHTLGIISKSKSVASCEVKLYPVERSSKLTSKISVYMCLIEMYKLYMDFSTASLITLSLSLNALLFCVCMGGGGRGLYRMMGIRSNS